MNRRCSESSSPGRKIYLPPDLDGYVQRGGGAGLGATADQGRRRLYTSNQPTLANPARVATIQSTMPIGPKLKA